MHVYVFVNVLLSVCRGDLTPAHSRCFCSTFGRTWGNHVTQHRRAGLASVRYGPLVSILAYCVTEAIAAILEQNLLGTFSPSCNRETGGHVLGSILELFLKRARIVAYCTTAWQPWPWTSRAIGTS